MDVSGRGIYRLSGDCSYSTAATTSLFLRKECSRMLQVCFSSTNSDSLRLVSCELDLTLDYEEGIQLSSSADITDSFSSSTASLLPARVYAGPGVCGDCASESESPKLAKPAVLQRTQFYPGSYEMQGTNSALSCLLFSFSSSSILMLTQLLSCFSLTFLFSTASLASLLNPISSNSLPLSSTKYSLLLSSQCRNFTQIIHILHQELIQNTLFLHMSPSTAKASQRVVHTVWSFSYTSQFRASSTPYLEYRMYLMSTISSTSAEGYIFRQCCTDFRVYLQSWSMAQGSIARRNQDNSFFIIVEVRGLSCQLRG